MGNNATKEARGPPRSRPTSVRNNSTSDPTLVQRQNAATSAAQILYGPSGRAQRGGSRSDLGFILGLTGGDGNNAEFRRETRQEREARKLGKEREEREKERERSLKEEHVDGGYLVTLGTYTGPEDFNKAVVRQLQIERRLAPFWKGLNDHKDSWIEHQLVAAVRGLPIPPADVVPPELELAQSSDTELHKKTIPIGSRTLSNQSDISSNLSASHPAFSSSSPSGMSSGMALFRGRARTLASLTSASRSGSSSNLAPPEIQLPKDPFIHGQPIEAYLYKDAQECPICFLYYPPHLNKTRCCDQPICSECFVQIKRPDPHPPEHHDDPSNPPPPPEQPKTDEEEQLVSEPSACPFCVTPEFGVTYEPPPFRRGLVYAGGVAPHPLTLATSAMSSSTSLASGVSRRRTTSLSASDNAVITTDRVRPDWAKKLADARAHALRRSAAATALHNAAYVLGNTSNLDLRTFRARRRRGLFGESASGAQSSSDIAGQSEGHQSGEDAPSRVGPRSRMDDLEDLMMMEAIRLSIAAEDDRKKKQEKDAAKDAKKKAKQDAKEAKKAEKAAKKAGKAGSLYAASTNQSTSTWASTSMSRSTSNLGFGSLTASPLGPGKGKAPASSSSNLRPVTEPTSALSTTSSSQDVASTSQPIPLPIPRSGHQRQLSAASSIGSSIMESGHDSPSVSTTPLDQGHVGQSGSSTPHQGQIAAESMFNFQSLAAIIGEEKDEHNVEHNELAEQTPIAERRAEDMVFPMNGIKESAAEGPPGASVATKTGKD